MNIALQIYFFGGLFYGYIIFMAAIGNTRMQKWLYTIPIWPLTLIVLFLYIGWRGLRVTFEGVAR